MTNDELEAIRARAASAVRLDGDMYPLSRDKVLTGIARTDIPALLDEAERLRSRAAPDPCEAQVPFDTPDGVTWFPAPLGSADPFDRATRAEAHAALLQTEATYWHDKHNQDRLALADSEAHAERLAGALEALIEANAGASARMATSVFCEYCHSEDSAAFFDYVNQPLGLARSVLSAYNKEQNETLVN